VAHAKGDWKTAIAFSDRILAVSPVSIYLWTRSVLEYEVGESSQGESYLERLLEAMRLTRPGPTMEYAVTALAIALSARFTSVTSRFGIGEAAAQAVISSPFFTPL
jgi:hypothetical protein